MEENIQKGQLSTLVTPDNWVWQSAKYDILKVSFYWDFDSFIS